MIMLLILEFSKQQVKWSVCKDETLQRILHGLKVDQMSELSYFSLKRSMYIGHIVIILQQHMA